MTLQNLKTKVESLVRQAEIGQALSLIENFANQPEWQGSAFRDNALLLSARYASLKDQHIKGTLSTEDYSKELSRLTESILSLLKTQTLDQQPSSWGKIALVSMLLLFVAGFVIWWTAFRDPDKTPSEPSSQSTVVPNTANTPHILPDTVHKPENGEIKQKPPIPFEGANKKRVLPPNNQENNNGPSASSKPKSVPVKIKVSLKADGCWRDAAIQVNGKTVGTMNGIVGSITLTLQEEATTVQLIKGERVSSPEVKVLEDEDSLLFKCN